MNKEQLIDYNNKSYDINKYNKEISKVKISEVEIIKEDVVFKVPKKLN